MHLKHNKPFKFERNFYAQSIDLAYEDLRGKHDLHEGLHDSLISVGFLQTPLTNAKDEIVINFARDDKFPSGLYIACCMLQVSLV